MSTQYIPSTTSPEIMGKAKEVVGRLYDQVNTFQPTSTDQYLATQTPIVRQPQPIPYQYQNQQIVPPPINPQFIAYGKQKSSTSMWVTLFWLLIGIVVIIVILGLVWSLMKRGKNSEYTENIRDIPHHRSIELFP